MRAECDRFLKIFEDTYLEVLGEMGLTPESGDYSSVVMTRKNLGEIQRRMVEKLNANPEARKLMAVLNVDFSGEAEAASGKAGRHAERPKGDGHHAARLDEARNFFFEEWRKKHREEDAPADQTASETGLEDLAQERRQTARFTRIVNPEIFGAPKLELLDFWQGAQPMEKHADLNS
jgi:hypothetical protein